MPKTVAEIQDGFNNAVEKYSQHFYFYGTHSAMLQRCQRETTAII